MGENCSSCSHWFMFKSNASNSGYNKGRCHVYGRVTHAKAGCKSGYTPIECAVCQCGTCRFWKQLDGNYNKHLGECMVPLPPWIYEYMRIKDTGRMTRVVRENRTCIFHVSKAESKDWPKNEDGSEMKVHEAIAKGFLPPWP